MKIIKPNFPHKNESKTFCVLLKRERKMTKFSFKFPLPKYGRIVIGSMQSS